MSHRRNRLEQHTPLPAGAELVSPSGRYALHYDPSGVPVVTDRTARQVRRRAGEDERSPAAGELRLSGWVQVELRGGGTWRSSVGAGDARTLVVTDAGELELLDVDGVRVYDSGRGSVAPVPAFEDAAPTVDITPERYPRSARLPSVSPCPLHHEVHPSSAHCGIRVARCNRLL
ncbi:hypothetical protein ACWD04_04950 [Streptomyces sp. NPDC002911]